MLELGAGSEHFDHSQQQWNFGIWLLVNYAVLTMLLNGVVAWTFLMLKKSVGGHVKKSKTLSFDIIIFTWQLNEKGFIKYNCKSWN